MGGEVGGSQKPSHSTATTSHEQPPAVISLASSNTRRRSSPQKKQQLYGRSIQEIVSSPTPLTNEIPRAKSPRYPNNVQKTFRQPRNSSSNATNSGKQQRSSSNKKSTQKKGSAKKRSQSHCDDDNNEDNSQITSVSTSSLTDTTEQIIRMAQRSVSERRRRSPPQPKQDQPAKRPQRHAQRRPRTEMGNSGRVTPDTSPSTPSSNSSSSDSPEVHRFQTRTTYRTSRASRSLEADRAKSRSESATRSRGGVSCNVDDWKNKGRFFVTKEEESSLLREGFRECLRTGRIVGLKMSECLVISADIYQQECVTQHSHRGDDDLFLAHKEKCTEDIEAASKKTTKVDTKQSIKATPTTKGTEVLKESEADGLLNPPTSPENIRVTPGKLIFPPPKFIQPENLDAADHEAVYDINGSPDNKYAENSNDDNDGNNSLLDKENEPRQEERRPRGRSILADDAVTPPLPQTAYAAMLEQYAAEFTNLRAVRLSMFQQDSTLSHLQESFSNIATNLNGSDYGNAILQKAAAASYEPARIRDYPEDEFSFERSNNENSMTGQEESSLDRARESYHKQQHRSQPQARQQQQNNLQQPEDDSVQGRKIKESVNRSQGSPSSKDHGVEVNHEDYIQSQQGTISTLEQELSSTKKALKEAVETLEHRDSASVLKQQAMEDSAEKLFRERVEVEERLRREMRSKEELSVQVRDLEDELKVLRQTLLKAKETARLSALHNSPGKSCTSDYSSDQQKRTADLMLKSRRQVLRRKEERLSKLMGSIRGQTSCDQPSDVNSILSAPSWSSAERTQRSTTDGHDTPSSGERVGASVTTRAEAVALRAQLAEEHAARLSAEKRVVSLEKTNDVMRTEKQQLEGETAKLRNAVQGLKEEQLINDEEALTEVSYLRTEIRRLEKQMQVETEEKSRMENEIDRREEEMNDLREKVGFLTKEVGSMKDKFQIAQNELEERAEQHKRIEKELAASKGEAERLRAEVARFTNKLERERMANKAKIQVSEAEARELHEEVKRIKAKLQETNADIVSQAAEHLEKNRRVENELEKTREFAQSLQKKVASLDGQVATKESEVAFLRSKLEQEKAARRRAPVFQKIGAFFTDTNSFDSESQAN
ncbi:hypothetical protein ACA910_005280 [Epithemia clementina (nom. ined.)]